MYRMRWMMRGGLRALTRACRARSMHRMLLMSTATVRAPVHISISHIGFTNPAADRVANTPSPYSLPAPSSSLCGASWTFSSLTSSCPSASFSSTSPSLLSLDTLIPTFLCQSTSPLHRQRSSHCLLLRFSFMNELRYLFTNCASLALLVCSTRTWHLQLLRLTEFPSTLERLERARD